MTRLGRPAKSALVGPLLHDRIDRNERGLDSQGGAERARDGGVRRSAANGLRAIAIELVDPARPERWPVDLRVSVSEHGEFEDDRALLEIEHSALRKGVGKEGIDLGVDLAIVRHETR